MSRVDMGDPVVEVDGRVCLTSPPKDSKARARAIKKCILHEEAEVRKQYPWLQYQNAIGLFWFLSSVIVICTTSWAYLTGKLEWYWTIPLMALPISILHELEHDLIHNLYFRKQKWMQNVMFAVIWVFKFHGNPWWRRDIHHWHHRVSGQFNDIEERILGLGMECDWKRLGVTAHPLGFLSEVKSMKRDAGEAFDLPYMNRTSMATAAFLILLIKSFPIMALIMYLSPESSATVYLDVLFPAVRDFMVLLVMPLVLRQSSLVAMSTGSHYYGDIPSHDVFFQNQILDHWTLIPFQIFCWFFGATHIIHHYIPNQPFYMRSLISKNVHAEMVRQGVRKNDWGIVYRANRWHIYKGQEQSEPLKAFLWFFSVFSLSSIMVFVWDFVGIPKVSLLLLFRFLTWPIYRHMPWYKKKVAGRKQDVGVPKVY